MARNGPSAFTSQIIDVDGYAVGVASKGSVKNGTIILIHGLAASEKYFRRLADILAQKYRVISITLPGYGETEKPARALDIGELTNITIRFIRQESIVDPIILGHSMGCQVAVQLANVADVSVEKMILIAPVVNIKERTAPLQFIRLVQDSFREPLDSLLLQLSGYGRFGLVRFLKTQSSMLADKIEDSLSKTRQPVLIIRGENDRIVSRDWTMFLLRASEQASIVEIQGAPHNVHFTHPSEVATACINFIER